MKISRSILGGAVTLSLLSSLIGPIHVFAAANITLGNADSFAVLAGSAISDTNPSVIVGNVGLSPSAGTNITALTPSEVSGTIYAVDATGPGGAPGNNPTLVNDAKTDLTAAFTLATQPTTGVIAADLGGQTLFPGVYDDNDAPNSLSIAAGQTLTLDGQNNPNAVFIFRTGETLITGAGASVSLINGAQACHVFWQIGSSATLGTSTDFQGTIMATASIIDNGGSTVDGRLLARTGAVTLDDSTVTVPTCSTASSSSGSDNYTGTISVVKMVVNDNGGTRTLSTFPLFVNDISVISGATNTYVANPSVYMVTETSDANYTRTFSGDCDSTGQMVLHGAQHQLCVITNDDIGVPVVVPPVPPLIDVVKVPSPLALPDGPGSVTYTYTLKNVGTVPVTDLTLVGDTCSPITLTSGDTNNDSKLDLTETWVYHCSTVLAATHTNTVVATGWANGLSATDVASATVVVGQPIVPPLIHITKVPSPSSLLAGGGSITYSYKVSNPGTEPLSNVFVTDDKCTGLPGRVTGHPGDLNNNDLLESSETWSFTCQSNLTATTTNVGTASGEANGLTATDFAIATVTVAAALPALPNTGFGPLDMIPVWPILTLCFVGGLLTLIVARKQKRT